MCVRLKFKGSYFMIESIVIKDIATYDATGITIKDFKKVNFIYGANGCGKTTISNLLHNVNDNKFVHCSVVWQNKQTLSTLVYNKEFRTHNFGRGKITGVFTLGQATTSEKLEIENKQIELDEIKKDGYNKTNTLESQKSKLVELVNDFKEKSWSNIYKKYESMFKDAFTGYLSKERFKDKLLDEFTNNKEALTPFDDLKKKSTTIFGKNLQKIPLINRIDYSKIFEIENADIFKKIIVGKSDIDIAGLIQKLNISDWVNQGKNYLQKDNNICPFCQEKTITENFKIQLDNFFDDVYIKDTNQLKQLQAQYSACTRMIITELNSIEEFHKTSKDSKLNIDMFSSYTQNIINQNITNNTLLNNKIKEPSRSIELISINEQLILINSLIDEANVETKKHNDIVDNLEVEKSRLVKSIWKFIIDESDVMIIKFNKDKKGIETGISNLDEEIKEKRKAYTSLDYEIKNLSKNITSIQPTVDEINRLLKSYGFLNFKIVPASEKGFYQIEREDGTAAEHTLSEGEITFITFLYYLQLANGGISEDTINEDRILVIDDPISSLDSNVLYIVSTLIKEIIKAVKINTGNIKQIILLTHNVYFHKEVSYEESNRKGEYPQFWILRKKNNLTNIEAYKNKNPIQSSYALLWKEIKEWEKSSGITIQNIMRRVLENYFNILGNKRDDFLINKFPTKEEQEICRSLLSWTNDGSHNLLEDLYVENPHLTIEKYLEVFKNIFNYTENIGHYEMMMSDEN